MITVLLAFFGVLGLPLFASEQTTPTNQDEDNWWVEAKRRGQAFAQLKRARAVVLAEVSQRIQEEALRALTKDDDQPIALVYTEAYLKATPEYAAYEAKLAEAQRHYLTFLQERLPSDPAIQTASAMIRPQFLYIEKAKYTEVARQNQVNGTVLISAIFRADGTVTDPQVIQTLPDGLVDEALKALNEIAFLPAQMNGTPVNVRMSLEFSFNLC